MDYWLFDATDNTIKGLRGGISTKRFGDFLMDLMRDWQIIDVYRQRAAEAIEFQYTFWPDPDNRTARGQEFINVCITALRDINWPVHAYVAIKMIVSHLLTIDPQITPLYLSFDGLC